jgi:hypothetical protein
MFSSVWFVVLLSFLTTLESYRRPTGIAQLDNGEQEAAYHEVKFDGSGVSSTVYFFRMQAGDYVETKRVLSIR